MYCDHAASETGETFLRLTTVMREANVQRRGDVCAGLRRLTTGDPTVGLPPLLVRLEPGRARAVVHYRVRMAPPPMGADSAPSRGAKAKTSFALGAESAPNPGGRISRSKKERGQEGRKVLSKNGPGVAPASTGGRAGETSSPGAGRRGQAQPDHPEWGPYGAWLTAFNTALKVRIPYRPWTTVGRKGFRAYLEARTMGYTHDQLLGMLPFVVRAYGAGEFRAVYDPVFVLERVGVFCQSPPAEAPREEERA